MTRTRALAALLAGLLAGHTVAGLGTAAAFGADDPAAAAPMTVVAQTRTAPTGTAPTSTPTVEVRAPAATPATTADDAVARAVAHLGGGTAIKIESETEHGRAGWKVDVRRTTGVTEVYVDAASGAVTRIDGEPSADRGRDDRGRHGGDDRRDDHGGRDGGHGSDDGPDHDRFDDHGGDRDEFDDHGGDHDEFDDHGGDDDSGHGRGRGRGRGGDDDDD